jgi:NADH:ubiquinone reductase (H+-translocating)
MQPSYFGHDEFARFAPSLKTITDAEVIRDRILCAFEAAEAASDPAVRARALSFVLVGGGATGVELAASLAQFSRATLPDFRRLDAAAVQITLVEGGERILPSFDPHLSARAGERLAKLGVTVLTGARVEHIDQQGVVVAGQRIEAATVLWTAGVRPPPVVKDLAAAEDRAGRILVGPDLRVPGRPEVFVVGDAAGLDQDGRPLPGVAQVAIQQGRYAADTILALLGGGTPPKPFRYRDKGSMAVVGKNFAVLETRHLRRSGLWPWLTWVVVHVLFLPQNQNRLRVPFQWLWTYATGQRGSRLIHERGTERTPGAPV